MYSSPLESNSTISLALNGGGYTTSAPVTTTTDNFGIEGFFMPTTTPTGNEILAYNGNTYLNGFGLLIRSSGEYSGIYGGVSFFDTGVQAVANTSVYFAMVRDNGVLSLYLDSNVAITPPSSTDTPFAASAASGVGFELGTDNINENFAGSLDEVRVFTFAPVAFNAAQDLEIDNGATAPEPAGASLILVCGLAFGAAVVVRKCWRRAS